MEFPSLQFLGTGSILACQSDLGGTCATSVDQREPDDRWGVSEDLPGRLCLPGWVQLVLGSHAWGVIAFGTPNPRLLPIRFASAPVEEIVKLSPSFMWGQSVDGSGILLGFFS